MAKKNCTEVGPAEKSKATTGAKVREFIRDLWRNYEKFISNCVTDCIPYKIKENGEAGHVGCALETVGGVVFTGICIDVPCSIGICAEQAAIAEMLKNRETKIKRIVAVYEDGSILPPCGRCRELMSQLDLYNENTMVVVDFEKEVRLKELLPERWDKKWD